MQSSPTRCVRTSARESPSSAPSCGPARSSRSTTHASPSSARRLLVTSAAQPVDVAAGYLNAYRARIADLVLVTMAEPGAPHAELADAMRAHVRPGVSVLRAVLRPRPLEPVDDARVAFFCTAP